MTFRNVRIIERALSLYIYTSNAWRTNNPRVSIEFPYILSRKIPGFFDANLSPSPWYRKKKRKKKKKVIRGKDERNRDKKERKRKYLNKFTE